MTKNIFSNRKNYAKSLLIFCACSAGLSLQSSEMETANTEFLMNAAAREHVSGNFPGRSKKKKRPLLKLSDLAGSWVLNDCSVGGVGSGLGGTRTIQLQMDIDKSGKGTVHFFQTAGYASGLNKMDYSATFDKNFAQFTFEILDPKYGIGRFTIEIEGFNRTNSLFIATLSSKNHKVVKMEGISNDSSLDKTNIRTFTITRQYVD